MRKSMWALLCLLSATIACGQSAKDAVKAFRDSMGKGQFVLRNFSGEDKVNASWIGDTLESGRPRWQTFGVLVVDSIRLKGSTLTMQCKRHVAVRDTAGKIVLYAIPAPVEIDVDMGGAGPAVVLPHLKEALFYASIGDALAALPKTVQQVIPARIDKTAAQQANAHINGLTPRCDCAEKEKAECDADKRGTEGVIPPKYLRGENPGYSEQAREAKLNGSVDVRLIVDKQGHPTDVWVARPLGMGLDEEAAQSVLTYVFRPAMCHESPVSVYLAVEVNFEIR